MRPYKIEVEFLILIDTFMFCSKNNNYSSWGSVRSSQRRAKLTGSLSSNKMCSNIGVKFTLSLFIYLQNISKKNSQQCSRSLWKQKLYLINCTDINLLCLQSNPIFILAFDKPIKIYFTISLCVQIDRALGISHDHESMYVDNPSFGLVWNIKHAYSANHISSSQTAKHWQLSTW